MSGAPEYYPLILVIDDEYLVRSVCRIALERNRFRVLCAEDGNQGLGLYSDNKTEIALVLCDLWMAQMSGPETIRRIRLLNASARVVVMTGYDALEIAAGDLGGCYFLTKPFTSDRLIRAVREALNLKSHSVAWG